MQENIFIAKAITYRILSMLITFTVVYLFTRNFPLTTGAMVLIEVLKTAWYYSYDKIWYRLGYLSLSLCGEKEIGIRGGYPLIPIPKKAKGFVSLMRPLTMLGGFVAGFFLVLLASFYYNIQPSTNLAFLVGTIFALTHAASQTVNQVIKEEIEIDRINKPYRPIVKGIITRKEGIVFSIALFSISIAMSFLVSQIFLFWILVIAFFSVFYSAPPFRIKKIFVLNNVWQGVARGFLPVVAVFSIFSTSFPPPFAIAFGVTIAIWIVGGQASKDIDDIDGDKRYGIRNFFTVLSKKNALRLMLSIMLFSFVILNCLIWLQALPMNMILLNVLLLPSFGIIHFNKKSTIAENNTGWVLFYSTIGLWYILPVFFLSF